MVLGALLDAESGVDVDVLAVEFAGGRGVAVVAVSTLHGGSESGSWFGGGGGQGGLGWILITVLMVRKWVRCDSVFMTVLVNGDEVLVISGYPAKYDFSDD